MEVKGKKNKLKCCVSFFSVLMRRSVHPPPETTSISLVLKLMAMLKQVE